MILVNGMAGWFTIDVVCIADALNNRMHPRNSQRTKLSKKQCTT